MAYVLSSELSYDMLWLSASLCSYMDKPRSSWSGFMQHAFSTSDRSYSRSDVFLLPIIDLQPSDESCIYSTLLFVQQQTAALNLVTPCITFNQPLWHKETCIISEKKLNIVCRLGGFHTLMSFVGSIGMMMSGSGLEEALAEAYAKNTVPHIMSGKAYSRALRGNFLVEAAVMNLLLKMVVPEDSRTLGESTNSDDEISTLSMIEEAINDLLEGRSSIEQVATMPLFKDLETKLESMEELLRSKSRTSRLWIKYLDYIAIVKMFIREERSGDWLLLCLQ